LTLPGRSSSIPKVWPVFAGPISVSGVKRKRRASTSSVVPSVAKPNWNHSPRPVDGDVGHRLVAREHRVDHELGAERLALRVEALRPDVAEAQAGRAVLPHDGEVADPVAGDLRLELVGALGRVDLPLGREREAQLRVASGVDVGRVGVGLVVLPDDDAATDAVGGQARLALVARVGRVDLELAAHRGAGGVEVAAEDARAVAGARPCR
jgi:hypothetical protein